MHLSLLKTTHRQPLLSKCLCVSLDGGHFTVGNLLQLPLQVLDRPDELVHVFLFFSQFIFYGFMLKRTQQGKWQQEGEILFSGEVRQWVSEIWFAK